MDWYTEGCNLFYEGKKSEAFHCFEEAIQLDSTDYESWNKKGEILFHDGKYSESLPCFDEAIRLKPDYEIALNNKGLVLNKQGFDESLAYYEMIKETSYKYCWDFKDVSDTNFFQNYEARIQKCDEMIEHYPNLPIPWRHKGSILIKSGQLEEALVCLEMALQFDPKYKEALNDKGRLYRKKKDYDKAMEFFEQALKINPNYEEANLNKERMKNMKNPSYFLSALEAIRNNQLHKVDLGGLDLANDECQTLSESLKKNYSLQELNLEDNDIGDDGFTYLLAAMTINDSLQTIKLNDNLIQDSTILEEFKKKLDLNKKTSLFVRNSQVNWNQIILKKNELKILVINYCYLKLIPSEINELQGLVILDLQNNELTSLPDLRNLNKLRTLNLSKNHIKLELPGKVRTYIELTNLLTSKLPTSIKHLSLEENDEISKEIKSQIEFIMNDVLHSSSVNILLNRDKLENENEIFTELFFWIYFVNKREISMENILEKINNLRNLNILDLSSNGLSQIPKESDFPKIENLCTKIILMNNEFKEFPEPILSLTKLKSIILKNNKISSIPENISQLTTLKEIYLENNQFSDDIGDSINSLLRIDSLDRIWIDNNAINNIPMVFHKSVNIARFSITQNKLQNFGGITEWIRLEILFLNENNLESIPIEIKNLSNLKKLHLNKNKITSIPVEIGELKELTDFQINNNLVEEIPLIIGDLINLETVDFSFNKIEILPAPMGLLNRLRHLNVKGNQIKSPPMEIANNLKDLKGYWKDLLMGEQRCNFLKLILVGEEEVGKTTLVRTLTAYNTHTSFIPKFLKRELKKTTIATDGINISVQALTLSIDKSYSLPNDQLIFNIWDFGGQEVYHSTHIFFLSSNAIYLVVWDMSKKEGAIARVIYWIQTIQTYIKNPMIILVGTHLDKIDDNPNNISEIYDNMSKKTKIPKDYIIGVSCKNGRNYKNLIEKIIKHALDKKDLPVKHKTKLDIVKEISNIQSELWQEISTPETELPCAPKVKKSMVGEIFPKLYFDLKKLLDAEGNKKIEDGMAPVVELKEFEKISEKINIIGEELKRGLYFLNCLGFCLYFSKDKELNKYIILNSQWLADMMATLITTKKNFTQNGLLNHQIFQQVWREPKYPVKIHSFLFELLQKFEILIPITHDIDKDIYSGKSLVPALLSRETKPTDLTTDWSDGIRIEIQRIYHFTGFLPSQIFPQFMASIFAFVGLKDVQYWRDGCFFEKENVKFLMELDLEDKSIITSFGGKEYLPLFKQIQLRLEMVLNKWENLNIEIYITCPICLYRYPNRNKCFTLKECVQDITNEIKYVLCDFTSEKNEVSLKKLVPEIASSEIKNLIKWEELEIESNRIGFGSFAEVYKGTYQNKIVAIKKLKMDMPNNDNEISEDLIREFLVEVQFLTFINHNNLLSFIGITLSPPSIILPFANYGSLYNFIHKEYVQNENGNSTKAEVDYSFELVLRIGLDIILGLYYLHSLDPPIIHCDLKSENVLLMNIDYKHPECVCKISDFGLSQFSVGRFLVHKNINPRWAAPEVIGKKDQNILSDIYSFGMILYELLAKQIPYSDKQNSDWNFGFNIEKSILQEIRPTYSKESIEKEFNTPIPNEIYEIMESCWDMIPKNRPYSNIIINLFYVFLSNYWKDIETHIKLPFTINKLSNNIEIGSDKFIELKNSQSITKIKKISNGSYGYIWLCKSKELPEGREYVVKEMKTNVLEEKKPKVINSFETELSILKRLNAFRVHPNIVQLIGYYKNLSENKFWIILEYYNGGSLENYLEKANLDPKTNSIFSFAELRKFFTQILHGLNYLHDTGYAHLDLKSENILIKEEKDKILNLCLCDFGTSKIQNLFQLDKEFTGTRAYMAPEIYRLRKFENIDEKSYDGMKADIWSLGFVLFRMLGEKFPSNGPFENSLSFENNRPSTYKVFQKIYSRCTQIDPFKRPSVHHISKWIK